VILDHGHPAAEGVGYPARALLHDVRQFMAKQKLSVRRVRIVLSGREVQIRSPSEGQSADGRCLRAYVNTNVGETGSEGFFHLRLNVSWQRPSAGAGTEIHLKRIHSRAALDYRFRLNEPRVVCRKGKRARLEEPLHYAAPAAGGRDEGRPHHGPHLGSRNSAKCLGRSHGRILQRRLCAMHQFFADILFRQPRLELSQESLMARRSMSLFGQPKFYPNLNPSAAVPVDREQIFNLRSFASSYRMSRGKQHGHYVPNSRFVFVTMTNGEMLLHQRYRHPVLSQGKPVLYAGEAFFNNGRLEWWSNGSGNYRPDPDHAAQAGLPVEQFYPYDEILKGAHTRPKIDSVLAAAPGVHSRISNQVQAKLAVKGNQHSMLPVWPPPLRSRQ
jgi:hypothetical protein